MKMTLVDDKTGAALTVGASVTTSRGETGTLTGWREPRHGGSSGHVFVRFGSNTFAREFFPSVIGARFVA